MGRPMDCDQDGMRSFVPLLFPEHLLKVLMVLDLENIRLDPRPRVAPSMEVDTLPDCSVDGAMASRAMTA